MNLLPRLLAALLLLAGAAPAVALDPLAMLRPIEGAWVAPSVPNTAWFLDLDENDAAFVAWYTYDASGRATFLVMQGTLAFRSELERRNSGVAVSLRSTIFEADNGACPTCPPRPANIRPSALGAGEFLWSSSRRGRIAYADRSIPLEAFEQTEPEAAMLEGVWRLDSRDEDVFAAVPSLRARYGSAIVRIARTVGPTPLHAHAADGPGQPARDPNLYNFGQLPSPGATYYQVDCLSGCTNADLYPSNAPDDSRSKPSRWVFWLEGGTFRMANTYPVSTGSFPTATQINGASLIGDVHPTQDRIVVRRRSARVGEFLLFRSELVLSRLPDGWTRP